MDWTGLDWTGLNWNGMELFLNLKDGGIGGLRFDELTKKPHSGNQLHDSRPK